MGNSLSEKISYTLSLSGLQKFQGKLQEVGKGVGAFKDKIGKAFKAVSTGIVAGLAAISVAVGKITKDFIALNESVYSFQAQLGFAEAPAQELADISKNIFFDNVGADIQTVNKALIETKRQTKLEGQELENLTKKVIMFNEEFGTQTPEVMSAVNSLMKNFGITSEEAFDFIGGGFQMGLNSSDDFLDSISEYGVQFADAGADQDFFFNTLRTGLQAGVLGTDKIGDSFKEFTNEMLKGTDKARSGLTMLGMDADQMFSDLQSGNITGAEAFDMVIKKLQETDGMFEKNTAGGELLGTMYEDLTGTAIDGLSTAGVAVSELGERTQHIEDGQKGLGRSIRGVYRDGLKFLDPYVEKVEFLLVDLIENFDPNKLKELIPKSVLDGVDTFTTNFENLFKTIGGSGSDSDFGKIFEDISKSMSKYYEPTMDFFMETINEVTTFVTENWNTISDIFVTVGEIVSFVFQEMGKIMESVIIPIFNDLKDVFMQVAQVFMDNWPAISSLIENGKVIIQFALSVLVKWWGILWKGAKFAINIIVGAWSFMAPFVIGAIEKISGFIANNLVPWFQERVPKAIEDLKRKWNIIQEVFRILRDKYNQDVAPKVSAIVSFFSERIPKAIENLREKWNVMTKLFGNLKQKYNEGAGKVLGTIKTAFENIRNVIDETIGRVGDLIGKLQNIPSPGNVKDSVGGFFNNINPFADGGIVGGSSFTGDKVIARVNSGEMILNRSQQSKLFGFIKNMTTAIEMPANSQNQRGGTMDKKVEQNNVINNYGSLNENKIVQDLMFKIKTL